MTILDGTYKVRDHEHRGGAKVAACAEAGHHRSDLAGVDLQRIRVYA